jgi:hypothetical protein
MFFETQSAPKNSVLVTIPRFKTWVPHTPHPTPETCNPLKQKLSQTLIPLCSLRRASRLTPPPPHSAGFSAVRFLVILRKSYLPLISCSVKDLLPKLASDKETFCTQQNDR